MDELRHPIIVGVHFIKTAVRDFLVGANSELTGHSQPTEKYPVSKTTPNSFHQDGHKFSFVHLVQRRNAIGGENVIAAHARRYSGLQPDDVPAEDVLAR